MKKELSVHKSGQLVDSAQIKTKWPGQFSLLTQLQTKHKNAIWLSVNSTQLFWIEMVKHLNLDIQLFPAFRAFWFLEKTMLREIRVSETVVMF